MRSIKRLDYFRRPKDDLERPTLCGAILSLLTLAAIVFFALKEVDYQRLQQVTKRIVVDSGSKDNTNLFLINIDITFVNAPCAALSFTMKDLSGKNYTLAHPELTFQRLDTNGTREIPKDYVNPEIEATYKNEKPEIRLILTGAKNDEQCRVNGDVLVNKVPGSLGFGHNLKKDVLKRIKAIDGELYDTINLSHRISHLFFSDVALDDDNCTVPDRQHDFVELDALEGREFIHGHVVSCAYYLKVIPISVAQAEKSSSRADYQYSYHVDCSRPENEDELSAEMYIGYDSTPIKIEYVASVANSIFSTIIMVSGIACGVFVIVRILHSVCIKLLRDAYVED